MTDDTGFREVKVDVDGATLKARFYAPTSPPRAHLVLHGATGVPQKYYQSFATWAAQQGVGVLTYDYRDFGESAQPPLRRSRATMAIWGIDDQVAAETALGQLAPDGPIWLLGHSLGGLMFPFRRADRRVERVIALGAGFANVKDHPWPYRLSVLAFWFGIGPLATFSAGYMPGRRLLLGADLPAGVYWQWRRWCTRRDFWNCDIGKCLPFPDFSPPAYDMRIFSMQDDVIVPPVSVARYADAFPSGSVQYTQLRPNDFGLNSLRHIEILSKRSASAWPSILGL